jgi:hypothetical protein
MGKIILGIVNMPIAAIKEKIIVFIIERLLNIFNPI